MLYFAWKLELVSDILWVVVAMESGVHLSFYSNCHHQITYTKFNLKIHYPPPCERETCHYQKANTDQIRKAIEQFSSDRSFKNLDVNEMVFSFNRTIKNILSNYIPHEIIICDYHLGLTTELRNYLMTKTILFNVTVITIRTPSYSIKLNIFKMNWSIIHVSPKEWWILWPVPKHTGQF